ncbi:unnamed protein product [Anisakis simplex]|uniref:Phlebovirus glycoprotein G2 fusion domain-containing protein n=1 Tax=Anisakis simplex TaxID=6269 RepID=A0A0M3K6G6_ANISI|nr:unnamed protein product [Anisakis simplex]
MIPPITGAMHHTVSRDAHQLLATESCVCATDFCNSEKPEITVNEKMKCNTFVTLHVMGTKVSSRNTTCTGEYCFKASIKSKIGHMNEYKTMGCASFIDGAELVEELQPVGCAKFQSEKVTVETCFQTKDRSAIGRARANQEAPPGLRRKTFKKITKTKNKYHEDKEEKDTATDRKEEEKEDEKEEDEGEEEEGENEEKESESDKENDEKESSSKEEEEMINVTSTTSKPVFIFEGPTEASIPEESNATLVFVFVLIMILIVMTGIVWKFGLHKRLFRAKYDTVAGG